MQILAKLKVLLENPFFKTLADFIKMFKSSKSFYTIFYLLALFTIQQAIAWKYGTALSAWFNTQGDAWYWQLGAFVAEHGSIELVGLGVVLLAILAFVEINKDNKTAIPTQGNSIEIKGNNNGSNVIGDKNTVIQKIEKMIIYNHKSLHWTPFIILAFTVLLSALPRVDTDPASQKIHTYKMKIHALEKKRSPSLPIEEKIKIEAQIKEYKQKIEEVEEYTSLLGVVTLKLAKTAEIIRQYRGEDEAITYLQGDKAKTQQKELDKRMKEFAQKFKMEAKLLIFKKRYDEAKEAYRNMIQYDRSYEALYEYATYLNQQNDDYREAIVVYNEILRLQLSQQDRAMTLHKLGTIYYKQNNFSEALKAYQKALDIRKKLLNYDTLVADTLNNIALIYIKQNNLGQALQKYNEALIYEESLVKNKVTLSVAEIRNNLGLFYKKQKNNEMALKNYSDALAIAQTLVENNASNDEYKDLFATIHNNLGNLYTKQQEYEDANKSFDTALRKYKNLADNNPSRYSQGLAMTYNNFGLLYIEQTKIPKANEVFMRANAIYNALAQNNPRSYNFELANTFLSLAYCNKILNQREVAQKSYKEALNIYRELAQINPNTYEFDYVKKLVRGVTDYNRDINDLQIAKEILSKEQYKYDASAQELLRKIELIKNG